MNAVKFSKQGIYLRNGSPVPADKCDKAAREGSMAYKILRAHEKKQSADGKCV